MLVSDVMNKMSNRMFEYDAFTPSQLIDFINDSIDQVANVLIELDDPLLQSTITLAGNTARPTGFVRPVPKNGYPVNITATQLLPYTSASVTMKYAFTPARVNNSTDDMPYPDYLCGIIAMIAVMICQNKFLYDLSQDIATLNTIKAELARARGGSNA